jgi:hypothetical protein
MSSVQSKVECEQCGFPHASKVLDLPSFEWDIICTRCGYRESWKHISRFSNHHLKKGVKKLIYSAGACCLNNGVEAHYSLDESEIEETAARMRAAIAAGELSPGSFVTRYNFETHEVTALVGRVPTHAPYEEDSDLDEACEAVDEQEDDDLSSEI